MTKVTDTDEMCKMLNEFNNVINELKNDYLVGQDEEIDDVIENATLVENNQLNFFDKYIEKFQPGSLQETIAERVKLNTKKNKQKKNKILTELSILLAQIKARNNSYKLKTEIR